MRPDRHYAMTTDDDGWGFHCLYTGKEYLQQDEGKENVSLHFSNLRLPINFYCPFYPHKQLPPLHRFVFQSLDWSLTVSASTHSTSPSLSFPRATLPPLHTLTMPLSSSTSGSLPTPCSDAWRSAKAEFESSPDALISKGYNGRPILLRLPLATGDDIEAGYVANSRRGHYDHATNPRVHGALQAKCTQDNMQAGIACRDWAMPVDTPEIRRNRGLRSGELEVSSMSTCHVL